MIIVGLDLAGVHSRPTGLCILRDVKAETFLVHGDGEIIGRIEEIRPYLIAVDAPKPPRRESVYRREDRRSSKRMRRSSFEARDEVLSSYAWSNEEVDQQRDQAEGSSRGQGFQGGRSLSWRCARCSQNP